MNVGLLCFMFFYQFMRKLIEKGGKWMAIIKRAHHHDEVMIEWLYLKKIKQLEKKHIEQWKPQDVLWETLSKTYTIDQFYIVYEDDEITPIGAFVITDYDPEFWQQDPPKAALYIHKVMVLDVAEKRGISDQILTFFKKEGRERGYDVVKLDVREYKDKLRRFYERNGFQLKEKVDLGKGYLTCLYEYRL